jgi:hypothetical protein
MIYTKYNTETEMSRLGNISCFSASVIARLMGYSVASGWTEKEFRFWLGVVVSDGVRMDFDAMLCL